MTNEKRVERILHDAHLNYQRQQLKADSVTLACPEQRGCRWDAKHHIPQVVFQRSWFTHLRPNFWKSYLDTIVFMAKP